jgi:hypothetical protein
MSVRTGAYVNSSGLILNIDFTNTLKSWKGRPTTNLYGTIDSGNVRPTSGTHFWDGGQWVVNSSYTHPGVPGPSGVYLGKTYTFRSGALNSTWSGNSYGYMLRNLNTTPATNYVVSGYCYVSSDCNVDAIPPSTEASTTDNLAVSGIANAYNMAAKGTWQRIAVACLSDGNSNFIPWYPAKYGVVDGSFSGFFMCAMPMAEEGLILSYPTETSRSTTQAFIDLRGNNTLTATSLTYASDGSYSFNGSSDMIILPENSLFNTQTPTVEVWVKPTSTAQNGFWFEKGLVNSQYALFLEGGNITWRNYTTSLTSLTASAATYLSTSVYNQVVGTYTSGTGRRIYVNGVQVAQDSQTGTLNTSASGCSIGVYGGYSGSRGYYYSGNIGLVRVYSNALTAAEVMQNFNSTRGRFGL